MTQLLLFDAPTSTPETNLLATKTSRSQAAQASTAQAANVAARLEYDSGVHQIGDLARLVLLRYELVAKRRAAMAAKREAAKRRR